MAKVKIKTKPASLRTKDGASPQRQEASKNPWWIWLIVILLIAAAFLPFAVSYFGQNPREEVAPTVELQPTSLPPPSLEVKKVEPTAEPTAERTVEPTAEPTVIPTVAPTPVPIESWQSAISLYLLTGLREGEALEAAKKIAQLNPSWASEYAVNTQKTLAAYHNISAWELERINRFAKLASAFDPSYKAKIQAEMERLAQEIEASQKLEAEPEIPEPEEPETQEEKVEVDLAPALSGPTIGIGISPEGFTRAYNLLRKIPHSSRWRVVKITKTPFFSLEISEITFQRIGPGNPQTTWFKGIFLGKLKEGDEILGKGLIDLLFP